MAKIKNLSYAIVKEPETVGAEIERKNLSGKDASQVPLTPKSAGASPKDNSTPVDPSQPDKATQGRWPAKLSPSRQPGA